MTLIPKMPGLKLTDNLNLPKTSGTSILVDGTNGWKDLVGQIIPDPIGVNSPTMTPIRGTGTNVKAYAFTATDKIDDVTFHIPHDWLPGSPFYAHVHWSHAGTAISGNLVLSWYATYCKGYNQAGQIFEAEKTIVQTIPTASVAVYPQYGHFIEEFLLTNVGGDATHLNQSIIEVDGLVKISITVDTIPTITGSPAGSTNEPFIFMVDLHYKTTGIIATKDKNFPFYV